jgi:hypothetical protein
VRDPESFDAFYARTVGSVTSQVLSFIGDAEDADTAVREAYARAFQQWYEVSGFRDAEGWVVDAAKDSYRRRGGIAPGAAGAADRPGSTADGFRSTADGAGSTADGAGSTADGAGSTASGYAGSGGAQPSDLTTWPGWHRQRSSLGRPASDLNLGASQPDHVLPSNGAQPRGHDALRAGPHNVTSVLPGADVASQPSRLGANRALAITVAVIVVALAAGSYLLFGTSASQHRGASNRPASKVHSKPKAQMLTAGKIGSRASIPWSLVGAGWTLAEVSTGQPDADGGPEAASSASIYLVDPKGGRYTVGQIGTATLLAWSGDGAMALLSSTAAGTGSAAYSLLTVASGQVTSLALPPSVTVVGFTRPDGKAIVAVRRSGGKFLLQRYDLAGQLEATIGKLPRRPTQPLWEPGSCGPDCGALSSPDGLTDVWGTTSNEMQLVGNAGGLIRRLPVPGSGKPPACAPLSWWGAATVLANCAAPGQPSANSDRLWLVPTDGSTPTPLTQGSGLSSGAGFNLTAAQTAGNVYVTQTSFNQCPSAASGPGGLAIMQVGAGGALSGVAIPGSTNTRNTVLAGVGSRLLVLAQTKCPGSYSLLWFSTASGTTQVLLAAPAGQLGVTAAVPFGTW